MPHGTHTSDAYLNQDPPPPGFPPSAQEEMREELRRLRAERREVRPGAPHGGMHRGKYNQPSKPHHRAD